MKAPVELSLRLRRTWFFGATALFWACFVLMAKGHTHPRVLFVDLTLTGALFYLSYPALQDFLRGRQSARWARNGLCPACGYDVRSTPDRCPECGHSLTPAASDTPPS